MPDYHFLEILALNAFSVEEGFKLDIGIFALEFLQCKFIVVGLWVAQFCVVFRGDGKRGFEAQNGIALGLGLLGVETIELEHLHDEILICRPNLGCGLIVVEIILFLSHSESALIDIENVHLGVALISAESNAERHAPTKCGIFIAHLNQIFYSLGAFHLVENGLQGRDAFLVAASGIHRQTIKFGKFLLCRSWLIFLLLQICQDTVDAFVVVLLEKIERAVAAICCRQGMKLLPATGSILIEIVGRSHCLVEVLNLNAGFRLSRSRHRGDDHQNHRKKMFNRHVVLNF